MRHLDLFSGIGGFALAALWVWGEPWRGSTGEYETIAFCDNDKAAQIVLAKHWPGVPIHDDIKTLDARKWRGTVDLVTGGFPCQPFSCAGKRRGKADDRYIWPQMLRVIEECKPRWIVAENVPGIVNMELDKVLADLEGEGYEVWPLVIPACAVDAPHIRARVWIVAYAGCRRFNKKQQKPKCECCDKTLVSEGSQDVADAGEFQRRRELQTWKSETTNPLRWPVEPDVGRVANGVPFRMDRLRLLGNAIVPQVAAEIFRAMKVVDDATRTWD